VVDPRDDDLVKEFLDYGVDLLRPYFDDEKTLHIRLRLVTEALCDDGQLWEESGRNAFTALKNGMVFRQGDAGARQWAELVEPLFRELYLRVPSLPARSEKDGFHKWLEFAGVIGSVAQPNEEIPALLAKARADSPTNARTHELSCLSAKLYRNKHGHGRWLNTGWRERLEIVETVLLTLLSIIDKHPVIERVIVFRQARSYFRDVDAKLDFLWSWPANGQSGEMKSSELAEKIFRSQLSGQNRIVVRGPRGVGLSRLGKLLTHHSANQVNEEKPLLLIPGRPGPSYTTHESGLAGKSATLADNDFMAELLGGDSGCWHLWWVQSALARGWLGIILDGLEQLDGLALNRFVLRYEGILRKWPQLRLVTLRPDVLPAGAFSEPPNVLGILAKGEEIRVEVRRHPASSPESPLPSGHPATLAYWLELGAAALESCKPGDAVRTLIEQQLAFDHDHRWPDFEPSLRKAATVVALNAIFRFVEELDEVADETRTPRLERSRYNEVLDRAVRDVLKWGGFTVAIGQEWPERLKQFRDAVDAALFNSDLVKPPEAEGSGLVWLAHPMIEECARADDYQSWVRSKWNDFLPGECDPLMKTVLSAD
jgi:hypothetical protein